MKAVFLDRDGTITKGTHLVTDINDIVLHEKAAEAIKIMRNLGYKIIVVTNQPQIARGLCTEDDVWRINKKMEDELNALGAKIDGIYICPHHPEMHDDIPESAKKYRIRCTCRKPETGMLENAKKDFDIDFSESFLIGDRTVDIQTGKNAGCRTILLSTGAAGMDRKFDVKPDYKAIDLLQAALIIKNSLVKAVILAGGRGERLRPITDSIPKPMINIAGKPLLQHQVDALRISGITDIVLCGSYMIGKIYDFFGDGRKFGVKIAYPKESERLGSGGAVKNAETFLRNAERLVIINGDKMIDDFDFNRMLEFDRQSGGFATLLVRHTDHPVDSDIVKMDDTGLVSQFVGRGQEKYNISNSGIIITTPEIIDYIPDGVVNLEKDVIFNLIQTKKIYGFMLPDGWFTKDIGTPERLEKVKRHFEINS